MKKAKLVSKGSDDYEMKSFQPQDATLNNICNQIDQIVSNINKRFKNIEDVIQQVSSKQSSSMKNYLNTIMNEMNQIKSDMNKIKSEHYDLTNLKLKINSDMDIRDRKSKKIQELQQSYADDMKRILNQVKSLKVDDVQTGGQMSDSEQQQQQSQKQGQKKGYNEALLRQDILNERQQDIDDIENYLNTVKDFVFDIAQDVQQQGTQIKSMKKNYESTHKNLQDAQKELEQAGKYGKQKSKKMIMLCGCVSFILLIIILMVSTGGHKYQPGEYENHDGEYERILEETIFNDNPI